MWDDLRGRPSAAFTPGQRLEITQDKGTQCFELTDPQGRIIARTPRQGWEWQTLRTDWLVKVERSRGNWGLVAITETDRHRLGSATPRLRPSAYTLRAASGTKAKLTRTPFRNVWTVRAFRTTTARIEVAEPFIVRDPFGSGEANAHVGVVELSRREIPGLPLSLVVVLALEAIRADAGLPTGAGLGPC